MIKSINNYDNNRKIRKKITLTDAWNSKDGI